MGIFVAALWLMSSGVAMSDDTGLVLPPAADESVYVVQERAYLKRGYLEVTPIFYTSLNGKFVGYTGAAVAVAYHLRENFALELTSSIPGLFFATFSDLSWELYDYAQLGPPAVDLKQMSYFGALSLQFSALYGKLSLYNLLLDYDFYVSGRGWGRAPTRDMHAGLLWLFGHGRPRPWAADAGQRPRCRTVYRQLGRGCARLFQSALWFAA